MTDPLLPPETFSDAMDEAANLTPFEERTDFSEFGPDRRGTPTIDMDLGPVDAAPKPKGPAWRLAELRAAARRLEMRRSER